MSYARALVRSSNLQLSNDLQHRQGHCKEVSFQGVVLLHQSDASAELYLLPFCQYLRRVVLQSRTSVETDVRHRTQNKRFFSSLVTDVHRKKKKEKEEKYAEKNAYATIE